MLSSPWNAVSIETGREIDGRYWADIPSLPGVMAYGDTRETAILAVQSLALRVVADLIEAGETVPPPFERVFQVA